VRPLLQGFQGNSQHMSALLDASHFLCYFIFLTIEVQPVITATYFHCLACNGETVRLN